MSNNLLGLILVVGALFLEAFGQISFKHVAEGSINGVHPIALIRHAWKNRWIWIGIFCFILEAGLWTLALRLLPISIAFPAGSICFVFVALLSRIFLHEKVGQTRWIGIALILSGVVLISWQ